MTYVSWAVLYEGSTDQAYFDLLLPRLMEDVVLARSVRPVTIPEIPATRLRRGPVEEVASEACAAAASFHLVFIHADAGGRNLRTGLDQRSGAYCDAMNRLCNWPLQRCIRLSPSHETEAWILADPAAVADALGYRGLTSTIGLPSGAVEAERLSDPKEVLRQAIAQVRGRRRPLDIPQIFPSIAQRQDLDMLRKARSFSAFEADIVAALQDLGHIALARPDRR
jgi:hypothetical protein